MSGIARVLRSFRLLLGIFLISFLILSPNQSFSQTARFFRIDFSILSNSANGFKTLANYVYTYKSELFSDVNRIFEELPIPKRWRKPSFDAEARIFVLLSMEPFIADLSSIYIRDNLKAPEKYTRKVAFYRKHYRTSNPSKGGMVESLADLEGQYRVSASLLQATLNSCRGFVPDRENLATLMMLSGKIIAAREDRLLEYVGDLLRFVEELRRITPNVLSEIENSWRTSPHSLLINTQFSYMESELK